MLLELELREKGYTDDDIADILNHFEYQLDLLDWEESVLLFENDEEIFKYLYIEDQSKESIIDTLLELGSISKDDLGENATAMGYMVDNGDESIFKLSNGRWVIFSEELIYKDKKQQM